MLQFIAALVAMFVAFAIFDTAFPARSQPSKRLWRVRGVIAFVLYYAIAFTAPFLWDGLLARYTLFDASSYAMQFVERQPWIGEFSIYYHLGVDGFLDGLVD